MGLYTELASFDTYDQSKRHPSEGIFISEITEQLHSALESDVITEPDYRHWCTQMKFIPLDTLSLQQEYLDHLNHCTYPNGPILGAYFTMNPNVQPSAPATPTPSSNLYDTGADIISQRTALDTDCDPNPNVQPQMHHSTTTSTHCDSENQSTQRIIHVGDRLFTLPPIRTSMQSLTTLRHSAEQTENLMAQSDFSQVQNSQDSEKDNKITPIVQRSRLQCDPSNTNSTTTTTTTTSTPLQLRNCADGSVDCAAHPTTSTTTSTFIQRTMNFNDTFAYDHDRQQQRLPMYSNILYFQIQSQVRIRKIDANHDIQRCRVLKILQLLTFGPDIEPEPPPVDLCNSLKVPQSGGHKYGVRHSAIETLELMTELEITSVLSQLDLNEYNGLALL